MLVTLRCRRVYDNLCSLWIRKNVVRVSLILSHNHNSSRDAFVTISHANGLSSTALYTSQVIFFFHPSYFGQLLPKLVNKNKSEKMVNLQICHNFLVRRPQGKLLSQKTLPAISPCKSSFRFSASASFSPASLVSCWNFSASVLAAAKFSFSEDIWMLSLVSICSLDFLSSSSSCVSFAWRQKTQMGKRKTTRKTERIKSERRKKQIRN